VPDRDDPLLRLPAPERARVARFLDRLERTRVDVMVTLAARPSDERAHAEAVERAEVAARESVRAAAIERVRADADEWVVRLYNRSTNQPGWYEANWGRPGSGADRANLAASLGEALTALVLWDRLDDADRDELLGPFAALLEEPPG
jgi:hypothetical protein